MNFTRIIRLALIVTCFCSVLAAQTPPLAISDEALPPFEKGVDFNFLFHAKRGIPPYVWTVAEGDLPDGLNFTPDGLLSGRPTRQGTYTFTLKVEDSGRPAHSITKEFKADVAAPLLLEWLESPKVHDNRIDGSVILSNGSKDDFDLTVVIVAVAENGRATAIGYEHFPLKAGETNVHIPFGNTLPRGGYVIHADAIAEIAKRNAILRQRLQTPQPLVVLQNP
jgi:Putative Ig domain